MSTPAQQPRPDPWGIRSVDLPYAVRVTGLWAWLGVGVVALIAVLSRAVAALIPVVVPLVVAVLLAAFLRPLVAWGAARTRVPRLALSLAAVLGLVAVVTGLATLAGAELAAGWQPLGDAVQASLAAMETRLRTGPLHLPANALPQMGDSVLSTLRQHATEISGGLLSVGSTTAEVLAGALIALFATFFFVHEGEQIATFLARGVPAPNRAAVLRAASRGWHALTIYARMQVAVAAVNAVGIGTGAALLGVPLVVPIVAIVFLASFVPLVGGLISGVLAVLVALADGGLTTALLMLLVVVVVHQVEVHGLQPFLLGRSVALHPLAVVVAVAAGTVLLGLFGALLAVPLLACANATTRSLLAERRPDPGAPEQQRVVLSSSSASTRRVPGGDGRREGPAAPVPESGRPS